MCEVAGAVIAGAALGVSIFEAIRNTKGGSDLITLCDVYNPYGDKKHLCL
jgi:hypothetical protein